MLDIGFSELALIGVVALIVIGPKRLPTVARTVGTLIGRAQRYVSEVKSEVSQQMAMEDIKTSVSSFKSEMSAMENSISDGLNMSGNTDESINLIAQASDGVVTRQDILIRAQRFKKNIYRQSSRVPQWYRNQTGSRIRVVSGAARMVRYRPITDVRKKVNFFN